MANPKKNQLNVKSSLHPRSRHRGRYDFVQLQHSCPALTPFVILNPLKQQTIDFANPLAVKMLNKALLSYFYNIQFWDIPAGYLCPPIPGRADYIHYLADLLASHHQGQIPRGKHISVLDVGMGANCIYPLIGQAEYGWRFVGADIDPVSVHSAKLIIANNPQLKNRIECRLQNHPDHIFHDMIKPNEYFDLTLCNPPFHASAQQAKSSHLRKTTNLGLKPQLNFSGQHNELWCEGGEAVFICRMIDQSVVYASQCLWFTSLVSKKTTLPLLYQRLKQVGVSQFKTIDMAQGQKSSRFIAWTFAKSDLA